jgi:hypothetical protein
MAAALWALAMLSFTPAPARAAAQLGPASIAGTTTSQSGVVALPGVAVSLLDASGTIVATTNSDDSGNFTFTDLAPGTYRVRGALYQFEETTSGPIEVRAAQQSRAPIDLPVAMVEHVNVFAPAADLATTTAIPAQSVRVEDLRMFEPVSTGDIQNVLALMPGAVHGPGGGPVSINGGRPAQTRVLLDGVSIVDPITGRADIDLPGDAIDAVQILPNPSGGEYGRLSAGVIQFRTRPAPNKLTFSTSNFVPEPLFRTGDTAIHGIRDFAPRLFIGGPLIKKRLFIAESVQYEYFIPRVYGVPETAANETTRIRVNSLTRIDAVLSPTQSATLIVIGGPRRIDQVSTGLFLSPSSAPNERINPYYVSAGERATIGHAATLESTVAARDFSTDVSPTGFGPMVLSPAGRMGNYFDTQSRDFQTLQWRETLTASTSNRTGAHLFKVGTDVLYGSYTGTDVSQPIELRRLDGTLAERIDFAGPASEHASGTDAAIFASDTWTPVPRVKIEPSLRLERDAMIGETHLAPRASVTIGMNASGSAMLHAGVGRFYERTPLLARSFTSLEPEVVTQFAANGVDPAGSPVEWRPAVAPDLHAPSSFIWNAGYEQRLNPHWQFSANVLERRGAQNFIVDLVPGAPGQGTMSLSSTGRSIYRELSFWTEFQRGPIRTTASYVWSSSRDDLNSLDTLFGTLRNPIIQPNQYGPSSLDVPHRLVAWSSVPGPLGLTFSDVLEYRTGFPYSAVDADQQPVGAANSLRFPKVFTVDFTIFHDVRVGGHNVRLIVRTYNLFNRFDPLEVQNNATSPDFGTFYSHVERRLALDFDLLP